ncbi:hypothetical protein E0H80_10585 [Acinetobacter sp. ANC 4779]|uniref:hypothetical protein n=1 Tax=Acinetobacter sp. ANC 4779 TaxID=2529848 RepID=UPI00103B8CBC|nr:hypothetical protein [Acinetobacter sp. ANC 4779]TCB49851.1 hypothetical protein E0H80_10585 [Acinetobacter sp. ANC 4779]
MEVVFGLAFLTLIAVWVLTFIGLISPKRLQSLRKSKVMTRKDVLIGSVICSVILFIVIGVSAPDPVNDDQSNIISANETDNEKTEEKNIESENLKIDYEIISDDKRGNITRKVSVELPERISEKQLREIANEIRNSDSNTYERTFIMYRIKGEESVAAWATTHFDPNLDVKFIRLNSDNFKKLLNIKHDVDGDVIGQWISPNGFTDHIVVFYKKDKQYFKQDFYLDATLKPDELLKDGMTYHYKDPDETQYFIIDSEGDLEYHGESGNIYIANKIKS